MTETNNKWILSLGWKLSLHAAQFHLPTSENLDCRSFDEALPDLIQTENLQLILCSPAIRTFELSLPKTSTRFAEQALPWKLEPLVSRPISELHYSYELVNRSESTMDYRICVAHKASFDQFIASLTEANLRPEKITFLSEYLRLDEMNSASTTLGKLGEWVLWKNATGSGVFSAANAPNSAPLEPSEHHKTADFNSPNLAIASLKNQSNVPDLLPRHLRSGAENIWLKRPIAMTSILFGLLLIPLICFAGVKFWTGHQFDIAGQQLETEMAQLIATESPQLAELGVSAEQILVRSGQYQDLRPSYLDFTTALADELNSEFRDVTLLNLRFDRDNQILEGQFLASNMERITQLREQLELSGISTAVLSATSTAEGVSVGQTLEFAE